MECPEPFPDLPDHPAREAGKRQLEQVGFSSEQIVSLLRVKALYQRGAYHEAGPSDKRQAFIRWLYLQGRLQS